jgi:hypothetical protein
MAAGFLMPDAPRGGVVSEIMAAGPAVENLFSRTLDLSARLGNMT